MQCFRKPPCIRWSYLSLENCALCVAPRRCVALRTGALTRRVPRSRSMKNDEDFPTWDPHLNTTADMPVRPHRRTPQPQRSPARRLSAPRVRVAQTMRNVAEDFLRNKTILFVGDSINGLVYHAAVRHMSQMSQMSPAARHEPESDVARVALLHRSCAS